ncbi:hypothetical protein DRP77_12110 [Candidatus Poribacteria bacterium]|nr:MAG: hypothetical protein DRP77_12110 [Candidatus Poribacteria bacterium]
MEQIFKLGKRRIGRIAFDSKVEVLLRDGLSQLTVMKQYALVGDPATKLKLPDREIEVNLERHSFAPGDIIRILPGSVRPGAGFSGRMIARVRMGDEVIARAETIVQNGRYDGFELRLPGAVEPGEAIVDLYAESGDEVAVGGAKISIGMPRIVRIEEEAAGDKLKISCLVSSFSGVRGIWLLWSPPGAGFMKREGMSKEGDRFVAEIPLPGPGESVRYQIEVVPIKGEPILSEERRFKSKPLPDLSVAETRGREPIIYVEGGKLIAELVCRSDERPGEPVEVEFFEGNPEIGGKPLGSKTVRPADWIRRDRRDRGGRRVDMRAAIENPLIDGWLAKAWVELPLSPGERAFFVRVDPEDKVKESNEGNNLAGAVVEVNLFGPLPSGGRLVDPRGRFAVEAPPGVLNAPLAVEPVGEPPEGQPLLKPFPGSVWRMSLLESSEGKLGSPVAVELMIDLDQLRRSIAEELGGAAGEAAVQVALEERVRASAIYLWLPEISGWRRLKSEPVEEGGALKLRSVVVSVSSGNEGEGLLDREGSRASPSTPIADWAAMALPEERVRLIKMEGDEIEEVGVGEGSFPEVGLSIYLESSPDTPLRPGDAVFFSTLPTTGGVRIGNVRSRNFGDGVLRVLSVDESAPEETWTLIFVDRRRFVVVGVESGLLKVGDRAFLGTAGEEVRFGGCAVQVEPGGEEFRRGDVLKLAVKRAASLRGETDRLGLLAVMRGEDKTPPRIKISVLGQDFADGDYVSSNPTFCATVTDDSGVDPESLQVKLIRNLIEPVPIDESKLIISPSPASRSLTVNIPLQLQPAKYELQVRCADLEGNRSEERVTFVVSPRFEMTDLMNHPNPFGDWTEITCVLSSPADEIVFKIYTLSGRLIWMERLEGAVGLVQVRWDGRDYEGREVANGVYYCRVIARAGGKRITKTIRLMRMR